MIKTAKYIRAQSTNYEKQHEQCTNQFERLERVGMFLRTNKNIAMSAAKASEDASLHNVSYTKREQSGVLTHCGLVTPYGGMELDQHWLR